MFSLIDEVEPAQFKIFKTPMSRVVVKHYIESLFKVGEILGEGLTSKVYKITKIS